nr:hypothetical protein B0A51_04602 [Rachicladosporium sp. CCFEE 5018]
MSMSPSASGGFIPTPAPSSMTTSTTSTRSALPHPRSQPLRPGGSKELAFIRYVDEHLLKIQRRFAKRTTPAANGQDIERDASTIWDDVQGYKSMREACKDVEELLSVIWISGTPSLQMPYLINLAAFVTDMVAGMPANPRQMFSVLEKLDHAFASLLQGRDVDSGERLPGFENRRGVSGTEKVRVRSLIERTRRSVMESLKSGELDDMYEPETEAEDSEDDGGLVLEGDNPYSGRELEETWEMQIARVYDRTVVELGESLEAPNIGIITEGRG